MDNQRNENGQFAPGHQGFKPVGAVSKKKNYDLDRLKEIFDLILPNVEKDLRNAGAAARLKTKLDISKILTTNTNHIRSPYIIQMLLAFSPTKSQKPTAKSQQPTNNSPLKRHPLLN